RRRQFLHGAGEAAWLEWRSSQMTGLYREMHSAVTRRRPDAKLMLTTAALLDNSQLQSALRPTLPAKGDPAAMLRMMGLVPERLEELGIVVPRPQRIVSAASGVERDLHRQWNGLPGLDSLFSANGHAAALHFMEPAPL